MIRAGIFDIGGVVASLDWEAWDSHWSARLNVQPRDVLNACFGGGDDLVLVGKVPAEDWWLVVHQRLGLDDRTARELHADLDARARVDLTMVDFIRSLRPPLRTAFCSNAWSDARVFAGRDGYLDAVDHFVTSAEVGISKPNDGIFRHTLELLGCPPSEALFVDDVPVNVEAARALGIHGIHHRSTPETIEAVRALL